MAKRERSRARGRGRGAPAPAEEPRRPAKPDAVRYAVVSLYAASCITLSFLVLNGEHQLYESQAAGLSAAVAALAAALLSGAVDALAGFCLSRGVPWIRHAVCASAVLSFAAVAFSFSEVIAEFPAFFIARVLSLLLELMAVFLIFRPASREWLSPLE